MLNGILISKRTAFDICTRRHRILRSHKKKRLTQLPKNPSSGHRTATNVHHRTTASLPPDLRIAADSGIRLRYLRQIVAFRCCLEHHCCDNAPHRSRAHFNSRDELTNIYERSSNATSLTLSRSRLCSFGYSSNGRSTTC